MLKQRQKQKQKALDYADLKADLKKIVEALDYADLRADLNRIAEALEKLVYLNEYQFKSAGLNIQYPKKGDIK